MDEIWFELDCDAAAPHFHEEMEILYVLSGRTAIVITRDNFVLGPEDFVVLNPFEHHEIYKEAGNHTLSAYIPMSVLNQYDIGNIRCCSSIQQEQADYLGVIRGKLAMLFKHCMEKPSEQRLYILSQLIGLLAILQQQFEVKAGEGKGPFVDNSQLRQVLLYVNRHFMEDITLTETAKQMYISKSHLSRLFQKQMGITFSDYLRKLRVNKAEFLLRTTEESVTQIALGCGFSNTNTMIVNFREEYGETPGVYRKQQEGEQETEREPHQIDQVSYLRLQKYAAYEDNMQPLNKQNLEPTRLYIDRKEEIGELTLCHRESISVGWAMALLQENVRNSVRRAAGEIGLKYLIFHGLLDDSLDVYHEDEKGMPWYSFTYIDLILDFVVSTGVKPWIELGFTPSRLREDADNVFGESYVQLPADLNKWGCLIEAVMEHLLEYYGIEEIKTWRYSVTPALYASYGVFTMEEYLEYYRCTYENIRKHLEDAAVYGGTLDSSFLRLDGAEMLIQFLDYAKEHDCLPEVFSFQSFSCEYGARERREVEDRIRFRNSPLCEEPAPPNADSDTLWKEITGIRQILDKQGYQDRAICLDAWNSTIWQRDLGNDTCYKAAYVVKAFLESMGMVESMNYSHLTDHTEIRISNSNIYHGGNGLFTYREIPKASYYAYCLLNRLEEVLLAKGDGYLVTGSKDQKRLAVMLYHYCHYDPKAHITKAFPEEEQRTIDRYYEFTDPGVRGFRIYLRNMDAGIYEKESYLINREHGSSYDRWMEMGSPKILTGEQKDLLEKSSSLGYRYEQLRVDNSGELLLSAVLDAHEVRLICLNKK